MIQYILMICAALAPAVILTYMIVKRDEFEPEPVKWLLGSAALGVVAAACSVIAVMFTLPDFEVDTVGGAFVDAFCRAAIPEECFKMLMLFIVAKNCEKFNERFDGIIYAVCIGMGFAGIENILYLFEAGSGWVFTGVLRAFISVPAHYFFAIIMGAFFSLAWFDQRNRMRNAMLALALPVCAHGLFDAMLFSVPVLEWGSAIVVVAFFVFFKRMRLYAASLVERQIDLDRARIGNTFPNS